MKDTLSVIALLSVFAAVLGLVVWKQLSISKVQQRAEQETLAPYLQAIQRGELERAWTEHTAPAYKAKVDLERLTRAWEQLIAENGALQSWKLWRAHEISEPGKGTFQRLRYKVTFQKHMHIIVWDVQLVEGKLKIIESFAYAADSSMLEPAPR